MTRYIEILFQHKFRLLVLALLVPLVASGLSIRLWRAYDGYEVVWVDDPGAFGSAAAAAVGYNNYLTPAQNAVLRMSNLVGTQDFNKALGQRLVDQGVIKAQDQAGVIASLSQLAVIAGGAPSSGGSAPGGASPSDHTITIHYVCSTEYLCLGVLPVVLDVYRAQYAALKAKAAATARATYLPNLQAAQARLSAANAALKAYQDAQTKARDAAIADAKARHQPAPPQTSDDYQMIALQHDVDQAQKAVDAVNAQLAAIDGLTQVSLGMSNDMYVIEGPKVQPGLYGVKGMRKDNLKTLGLIWAACLVMAVAYVVVVTFMDRSVRDPDEIKKKLGRLVITIPEYLSEPRGLRLWTRRLWSRA